MPERYEQVTTLQDTDYIRVVTNPETRNSQDAKISVSDFFTQILPSRNISATGINMIGGGVIVYDTDGGSLIWQDEGFINFTNEGIIRFGTAGRILNDTGSNKIRIFGSDGENNVLTVDGHYEVLGTQVVGAQGAAITAPAGGGTQDAESRTAIAAILARLRAHGLIAT